MTPHTRACILSTGDELITGQLQDTNMRWLASELTIMGISVVQCATVPDDLETLTATMLRLTTCAPLLIVSGGLGPTEGDLTRHALAEAMSDQLVTDDAAQRWLDEFLRSRGRNWNALQARQTLRPSRARMLPNAVGTAPGLHGVVGEGVLGCDVFCLPGPPNELSAMWRASVLPALRPPADQTVRTRLLHVIGIGEADLASKLGPMMARTRLPLIGVTASQGVLTLRLRYAGPGSRLDADAAIDADVAALSAQLGDNILGDGSLSTSELMIAALGRAGKTLAVAESCTGGLLGAMLTQVPGSSTSFSGGLIVYSNGLKTALAGVPSELIAEHGAVSSQVAAALASGARERTAASYALAITGIAGPDGGSVAKPVGTVYIGLAGGATEPEVRHFRFSGTREDVRARAAGSALGMLHFELRQTNPRPKLLWQQGDAQTAAC